MIVFDYLQDHTLEDERVRLVPLAEEHLPALEVAGSDPQVWEYLLEDGSHTDGFKQYVRDAIRSRAARLAYPFVVFDKQCDRFVGTTRLYEINSSLQNVRLGYTWYDRSVWGTGLNVHCKFLLFEWIFEELMAARIGFGVHSGNIRSLAALRKLGCREEGTLRSFLPDEGHGRADIILFSLLREEWVDAVRQNMEIRMSATSNT